MTEQEHKLNQEQINHFLEHGWLKLSNCFSREAAAGLQSTLWTRLGMDPNDMSTWYVYILDFLHPSVFHIHLPRPQGLPQSYPTVANICIRHTERTNMPWHNTFQIPDFSPKTWTAINQLLSPSQPNPEVTRWTDGFIV
jgi:hypothetical protein